MRRDTQLPTINKPREPLQWQPLKRAPSKPSRRTRHSKGKELMGRDTVNNMWGDTFKKKRDKDVAMANVSGIQNVDSLATPLPAHAPHLPGCCCTGYHGHQRRLLRPQRHTGRAGRPYFAHASHSGPCAPQALYVFSPRAGPASIIITVHSPL